MKHVSVLMEYTSVILFPGILLQVAVELLSQSNPIFKRVQICKQYSQSLKNEHILSIVEITRKISVSISLNIDSMCTTPTYQNAHMIK